MQLLDLLQGELVTKKRDSGEGFAERVECLRDDLDLVHGQVELLQVGQASNFIRDD